jgi:hypothetical protein
MAIDKAILLFVASDWLQGTSVVMLMTAVRLRQTKLCFKQKNLSTGGCLVSRRDYSAWLFKRAQEASLLMQNSGVTYNLKVDVK